MPLASVRPRKASLHNSIQFVDSDFSKYIFLIPKNIVHLVHSDINSIQYWNVEVYFRPSSSENEIIEIEPGDVLFLKCHKPTLSHDIIVQIETVEFSRDGRRATLEVKRV